MEKAVRDKIVMQQKQQREEEARKRKQADYDELDDFDDEETREIMRKMRDQRLKNNQEMPQKKVEEKRVVGEYRQVNMTICRLWKTNF